MPYYNYHSTIKSKLKSSKCPQMYIINNYKYISPCLMVVTDDKCYPIREYRWEEYFELGANLGIKVEDKRENE